MKKQIYRRHSYWKRSYWESSVHARVIVWCLCESWNRIVIFPLINEKTLHLLWMCWSHCCENRSKIKRTCEMEKRRKEEWGLGERDGNGFICKGMSPLRRLSGKNSLNKHKHTHTHIHARPQGLGWIQNAIVSLCFHKEAT